MLLYSGLAGYFIVLLITINKVGIRALKIRLRDRLDLQDIWLEGNPKCVIGWASATCRPPWHLLDEVEEVIDLARNLTRLFLVGRRLANVAVHALAKEGVLRQS